MSYTDQDYLTIRAMETYGGSFVKALAACFWRADPNNYLKLRLTFADYWAQYEKMGERYAEELKKGNVPEDLYKR